MSSTKQFPTSEENIMAILPSQVKVIRPVQGVFLNIKGVAGRKNLPIVPVNIPIGTVINIKKNEKDSSQIETDYKVEGNIVFTTAKQLLNNVEFVQSDVQSVASEDDDNSDETPKKDDKMMRNILIGAGVLVGAILVYKFVINRNA